MLLAVGDRYEAEIAAARRRTPSTADAALPLDARTTIHGHPTALFYVFCAVLLFAAFRVITARNPVHAALFLVLAFFTAAGSGCCCAPSSSRSRWCWSTSAR